MQELAGGQRGGVGVKGKLSSYLTRRSSLLPGNFNWSINNIISVHCCVTVVFKGNSHKFVIPCSGLCASKGPKYDIFSLKIIIRRIFIIKSALQIFVPSICFARIFLYLREHSVNSLNSQTLKISSSALIWSLLVSPLVVFIKEWNHASFWIGLLSKELKQTPVCCL